MRTNEERKDMRMLIEALYGKEILKEMLDVLKAFNSCHITHEFGKDKVSTCWCIKSSYASDHYTTREFTADDFYSPEERDENFTAALREAAAAGVKILAYDCGVQVGKVWIEEKIPVEL